MRRASIVLMTSSLPPIATVGSSNCASSCKAKASCQQKTLAGEDRKGSYSHRGVEQPSELVDEDADAAEGGNGSVASLI